MGAGLRRQDEHGAAGAAAGRQEAAGALERDLLVVELRVGAAPVGGLGDAACAVIPPPPCMGRPRVRVAAGQPASTIMASRAARSAPCWTGPRDAKRVASALADVTGRLVARSATTRTTGCRRRRRPARHGRRSRLRVLPVVQHLLVADPLPSKSSQYTVTSSWGVFTNVTRWRRPGDPDERALLGNRPGRQLRPLAGRGHRGPSGRSGAPAAGLPGAAAAAGNPGQGGGCRRGDGGRVARACTGAEPDHEHGAPTRSTARRMSRRRSRAASALGLLPGGVQARCRRRGPRLSCRRAGPRLGCRRRRPRLGCRPGAQPEPWTEPRSGPAQPWTAPPAAQPWTPPPAAQPWTAPPAAQPWTAPPAGRQAGSGRAAVDRRWGGPRRPRAARRRCRPRPAASGAGGMTRPPSPPPAPAPPSRPRRPRPPGRPRRRRAGSGPGPPCRRAARGPSWRPGRWRRRARCGRGPGAPPPRSRSSTPGRTRDRVLARLLARRQAGPLPARAGRRAVHAEHVRLRCLAGVRRRRCRASSSSSPRRSRAWPRPLSPINRAASRRSDQHASESELDPARHSCWPAAAATPPPGAAAGPAPAGPRRAGGAEPRRPALRRPRAQRQAGGVPRHRRVPYRPAVRHRPDRAVLAPQASADACSWLSWARQETTAGYRVLALDFAGEGRSQRGQAGPPSGDVLSAAK